MLPDGFPIGDLYRIGLPGGRTRPIAKAHGRCARRCVRCPDNHAVDRNL